MRILCLGDVVGAPGREILSGRLRDFRREAGVDFCIANIENCAGGAGVTDAAFRVLRQSGIDVCTTGDHVYRRQEILKIFRNEPDVLIRPLNYSDKAPGRGWTVVEAQNGVRIGVINLQGRVFMNPSDDPFRAVEEALPQLKADLVFVDLHAEATSEKRAMGWFLDGKVTAVFGTHTHVPTADEEILPGGTAYVSDLGMCGPYGSVIGRRTDRVVEHFRTGVRVAFDVARDDPRACGVLVDADPQSGRAQSIERVVLRP